MCKNIESQYQFIREHKDLINYDEIALGTLNPRTNKPYKRSTVKEVLIKRRNNQHILDVALTYLNKRLSLKAELENSLKQH